MGYDHFYKSVVSVKINLEVWNFKSNLIKPFKMVPNSQPYPWLPVCMLEQSICASVHATTHFPALISFYNLCIILYIFSIFLYFFYNYFIKIRIICYWPLLFLWNVEYYFLFFSIFLYNFWIIPNIFLYYSLSLTYRFLLDEGGRVRLPIIPC